MQVERLRKRGWPLGIPPAGPCDALRAWCRSAILVVSVCALIGTTSAHGLQRATYSDTRDTIRRIVQPIRPGDSLDAILAAHGIGGEALRAWMRAARRLADVRRLEPGRTVQLELDALGRPRRLRLPISEEQALVLERGDRNAIVGRTEALPVLTRGVAAQGVVTRTFLQATRQAAIPDPVVKQMLTVLGTVLSFKTDVRRGDTFRVLYEDRASMRGRPLKPGRIIAVEYLGRSARVSAYLTGEEDGEAIYVDGEGRRLTGATFAAPVEFTHITSEFAATRFHPILLENRPHLGVDFAAPAGTPVRAIGTGVVQWAGSKGGFGNHVELDHGADFVSAYSHLQAIDPAIKVGDRVVRGQLLGWVGQTGLATGPHLHFAIFEHGEYVDPLSVKRLALQEMEPADFQRLQEEMQARLRSTLDSSAETPSAPEIGLPLAKNTPSGPIHLTF